MQKALATKVELIGDLDKGRLVIEYYSQADLEALYNLIAAMRVINIKHIKKYIYFTTLYIYVKVLESNYNNTLTG